MTKSLGIGHVGAGTLQALAPKASWETNRGRGYSTPACSISRKLKAPATGLEITKRPKSGGELAGLGLFCSMRTQWIYSQNE